MTDLAAWRKRIMPPPGKGDYQPGEEDPFYYDDYFEGDVDAELDSAER